MEEDRSHVEPYVRCCECQRIEDVLVVGKRPGCICGSKRFRPLSFVMNDEEADRIRSTHPEYFASTFEESTEADANV